VSQKKHVTTFSIITLTVRADMGSVWTPGRHLSKNSVSYWRSKITTKIVIVLRHVFGQSVQSVKC